MVYMKEGSCTVLYFPGRYHASKIPEHVGNLGVIGPRLSRVRDGPSYDGQEIPTRQAGPGVFFAEAVSLLIPLRYTLLASCPIGVYRPGRWSTLRLCPSWLAQFPPSSQVVDDHTYSA